MKDRAPIPREHRALDLEDEDEFDAPLEPGVFVDPSDGSRVIRVRGRSGPDDEDSHECPDEPPRGWGIP